ncbi:hypothetical protein EMIHUDRAFT_99002 [Emiliania huxleyi CCMP1516]|uniref:Apple domain-containing protein n=2 Tax=Emiliania huxleyi TaxID=2903 RepID=A0A0D3K8B2_EMIH1|nr:hypothetical protein EMIHUDRAFT_99002 [Emiliania huxleyi CCMP1516]EOD31997.1 hypothetical protein EMIHUDRAFT_99002 [Emiliania huxleyi CCMP1516]|eukprot:XP_005784426.1 hypothetical protein EMIHUDRAFT_99002 [Emiliania huxleyi CCMP1516]
MLAHVPTILIAVALATLLTVHILGRARPAAAARRDTATYAPARSLEIEIATPRSPTCGDGVCEAAETSCPGDCPGITTPTECGEEPHSDPAGEAVAWGSAPEHRVRSAAECCQRCMAHAAKNTRRPCNSWSFCYLPHCWSLDNGNTHTHGECWLKWQADVRHPLFGQRGRYSESFRRKNWDKHLSGRMPDGSKRNLTPPTHVPWTGGVIGRSVDYPRVTWTTDLPGADGAEMSSSAGERIVPWRAWESREQNLARGVPPEYMPLAKGNFGS